MSLLVETGDGIAGCLAVLGGRDLSKCFHDDLTGAVEAITGIPGHLYRFFYTNKKITSDLSLHDQGLVAGHRLNLHVTIRGGMPRGASDQDLEEYYADSDAERCHVVDSISECLYREPVFSKSGNTFSRSTLVQNGLRDPVSRQQLTAADLIPNILKQQEVDDYLQKRLKADIAKFDARSLCQLRPAEKFLDIVSMVAGRSDLTACLMAQRLLIEVLQQLPTNAIESLVVYGRDKGLLQALLQLAGKFDAEKVQAKLRYAETQCRMGTLNRQSVASALPGRPAEGLSLFSSPRPQQQQQSSFRGASGFGAPPYGQLSPPSTDDEDDSGSDSDDSAMSDCSSVSDTSSLASNTSGSGRTTPGCDKTTIRISPLPAQATPAELRALFHGYREQIKGVNIIEPNQQRRRKKKPDDGKAAGGGDAAKKQKRFALIVFGEQPAAFRALGELKKSQLHGMVLRMSILRKDGTKPKTERTKKGKKKAKEKKASLPTLLAGADSVPSAAAEFSPASAAGTPRESCAVKVINLHYAVTEQELLSLFATCSGFLSVHPHAAEGKKPQHAFVNFKTHEDALMAIQRFDQHPVRGKPIHCSLQAPKGTMQNTAVFPLKVINLDDRVTESDLHKLFSQCGRVAKLLIHAQDIGRVAYVNFLSESEQRQACRHLDGTRLRTKSISVSVQSERMILLSKDQATGVGGPSSSSAHRPFVDPGPQVLADGQVKSLGRARVDRTPTEPPVRGSAMGVAHAGSGAYGGLAGAGLAGSGIGAYGTPVYSPQQSTTGMLPPPGPRPLMQFTPPPPMVTAVGIGAFQSQVMMPTEVYQRISPLIQVHVEFHKSLDTFSSYKGGKFVVQGSDHDSVLFVANKAYEAIRSFEPAVQPSFPQQNFASSTPARQSAKLPLEKHLMKFLVHCRSNLIEKLKEKFLDLEVEGFREDSDCLEFSGSDCEAAIEFTRHRYAGYQFEEVSCMTTLVEPACFAARNDSAAVIYVPPCSQKPPPPHMTIIIAALGRKPIDRIKDLLGKPEAVIVDVPVGLHKALQGHPTAALTKLRAEFHIAYVSNPETGTVRLQGFIADDIRSAQSRLLSFVKTQHMLSKPETAELSCSDVAMRFLVRALFTLDDEHATAVIQQLESNHDVKIEKNSESKIAITGLPGCIETAQKEITQGDLLGSFSHRVHNIPGREANMNLIRRCGLDVVESQCRVICFMRYQAPAQDHSGGGRARGLKIGTVVVEVCGTINAEVQKAFKAVQQLKIENEAWPLGDGEDYKLLDQWQRSRKLAKLQGEAEFVLERKGKVLYCNALRKDIVKSQMADLKQQVGEQRPQVLRVSLSAVQREFLQQKRRDELEMFWAEHQVKAVFEDGCLAVSGLSDGPQKARQEVDKLLAKCGTATVVIDQRQRMLSRYFHAAYGGVKSEVEDSLDALVLLPTQSEFYALGGSRRGGGGGGASNRGRGQGRGRGRGGARGHRHSSSSHGDGDGSDGEGAAVELCVHVMAGSAAQCQKAEQQICAIGLACTHLTISISMQSGARIIDALKAKKIQPHLHRAGLFVKGTAVHINAMTQDEAEQVRDAVTEFVASELVTQDHYQFPSVVVGYLAVTREMPRLRQLAKECSGVRFNQVRTDNRTARLGSAGLTVSGKPADVLRFRGNLDHLSATLAASVKVEQVPAEGLAGTALSECADEIRTIERNHGVLCSWTDGRKQRHGSTAGLAGAPVSPSHGSLPLFGNDDSDNDDVIPSPSPVSSPSSSAGGAGSVAAAAAQQFLASRNAGGFFSTLANSMFPGMLSSSKVTAPSPSATATTGHWEWKDDSGWKTYTPAVCSEIDKAKAMGGTHLMSISNNVYRVDPQAKTQTNLTTQFARPIRYVAPSLPLPTAVPVASSPGASSLGRAEWLFQDDDGTFKRFSSLDCAALEAARSRGEDSYSFTRGQFLYRVSLSRMTQTNGTTGKTRSVKCQPIPAPRQQVATGSHALASSSSSFDGRSASDAATSSGSAVALPKFFCPIQSGLVVASVNVQVEGTDRDVAAATIKIKQLLLKAVTEVSIPVPVEMSHSLLTQLESLSKRHLVRIVINSKSPTRTASAASGSANCVVVIRGAKKRTEQCERLVSNLLLKEVSRVGMVQQQRGASQSHCPPPREWEPQQVNLELKQVSPLSNEFCIVQSLVQQSLPRAVLICVERIQNRFLWDKYVAKRDSIAKKIGQASERLLFHGTRNNPPQAIYHSEEGFETRFSSKGMWGEANYFAVDARYSDAYAHKPTPLSLGSDQQKQMFLAKVIVGDSIELQPDSKLNKPPVKPGASSSLISAIRHDTVNGVTQGCRVYMVYADSQAYPFYLLTYHMQ